MSQNELFSEVEARFKKIDNELKMRKFLAFCGSSMSACFSVLSGASLISGFEVSKSLLALGFAGISIGLQKEQEAYRLYLKNRALKNIMQKNNYNCSNSVLVENEKNKNKALMMGLGTMLLCGVAFCNQKLSDSGMTFVLGGTLLPMAIYLRHTEQKSHQILMDSIGAKNDARTRQ